MAPPAEPKPGGGALDRAGGVGRCPDDALRPQRGAARSCQGGRDAGSRSHTESTEAAAAEPVEAAAAGAAAEPSGGAASEAEIASAEAKAAAPKPRRARLKKAPLKKRPKQRPADGEAELPAEAKALRRLAKPPPSKPSSPRQRRSHQQGHNNPAKKKAAEAQAAAKGPENEIQTQAAGTQVDKMGQQRPAPFDRAGFKAALLDKIAAITPRNLEEADDFKKKNKAASIKGDVVSQVDSGKAAAQGPIQQTTEEPPTRVSLTRKKWFRNLPLNRAPPREASEAIRPPRNPRPMPRFHWKPAVRVSTKSWLTMKSRSNSSTIRTSLISSRRLLRNPTHKPTPNRHQSPIDRMKQGLLPAQKRGPRPVMVIHS